QRAVAGHTGIGNGANAMRAHDDEVKFLGDRVGACFDQKAESSPVDGRCRFADGIGDGAVELKWVIRDSLQKREPWRPRRAASARRGSSATIETQWNEGCERRRGGGGMTAVVSTARREPVGVEPGPFGFERFGTALKRSKDRAVHQRQIGVPPAI